MSQVLRVKRLRSSLQEFIFTVPHSYPNFEIRQGARTAVIATGLAKTETRSFLFYPHQPGFFSGSVSLQSEGIYEFRCGTRLHNGDCTWEFNFIRAPHLTRRLLGPSPRPSEDDRSVVLGRSTEMAVNPSSCIFRRNLRASPRNIPLWLPSNCDTDGPTASKQRRIFFDAARTPSSWDADTAVSFPYESGNVLLATLKTLPTHVHHLVLINTNADHSVWLKACILAASIAPAITSVTVEYTATDDCVIVNEDSICNFGNLDSFRWLNISSRSCLGWFFATLKMNPRLRKLAIGGQRFYILEILRALRWRQHLQALELHLQDFTNPQYALELLQARHFQNLREITLVFDTMPDVSLICNMFRRFAFSLVTIGVTVMRPQPHLDCDRTCRTRILPETMPALRRVTFNYLKCSSSAIAQALFLNNVRDLSLQVHIDDDSRLSTFLEPRVPNPIPFSIQKLAVSPGFVCNSIIVSDTNWDNLRQLTVNGLQLRDIPSALKLARNASTVLLIINRPSRQLPVQYQPSHRCERTVADHQFVDNGRHLSTLSCCTRLRSLKIVFGTQDGDGWDQPTLGKCFFLNGLRHLRQLTRFECNEISSTLMIALQRFQDSNPRFTFEATLHSLIPRLHI